MKTRLHTALMLVLSLAVAAYAEKNLDQLKAEAAAASGGHQAQLYAELAERTVTVAADHFAQNDPVKGQASVQDVVAYASRAHEISLQHHGKMKEVEIHLRLAQRHLENMKRSLLAEDRPPIEEAEKKLAAFRQDLLDVMFAPKKKEEKKDDQKPAQPPESKPDARHDAKETRLKEAEI